MNIEEALIVLDTVLENASLSDLQEQIFRYAWEGQKYSEIADRVGYDTNYVKDVGSKLWKLLSNAFAEEVTKTNLQSTFRRQLQKIQATTTNLSHLISNRVHFPKNRQQDWGEAIDASIFYGRERELETLHRYIVGDRCRLVALLGMGGIGKTALAVKLAEQIQGEFQYLIWRSLRNAMPVEDLLVDLIQFLSNQKETEADLPKDVQGRITRLLHYLRQHRSLIVIDNVETILQKEHTGRYREDYEGYGELFQRLGETRHESCVILTSREKPKDIAWLEGETLPVRSLSLSGLDTIEAREIVRHKGDFLAQEEDWQTLTLHYAGNPLALKMVAPAIRDLFNGDLTQFLRFLQDNPLVFDDIRDLLDRQFNRLSDTEKEVMYWLAINRELVSYSELQSDLFSLPSKSNLMETLKGLGWRSLIEKASPQQGAIQFTQQPVVMEYMTERFIEKVMQEICTETVELMLSHALIKATAKDYVRDSQIRLILQPICDRLNATYEDKSAIAGQLQKILAELHQLRDQEKQGLAIAHSTGYGGGNLINLLHQLDIDLTGYDFSHLTVWQAYLQNVKLHRVNFACADLTKSIFAESLGSVMSVAISPDGKLLAMGDQDGVVCLWDILTYQQVGRFKGHTSWVWSVAFSPDSQTLASGSYDRAVKLWDIKSGQCRQTLQEHTGGIWSIAFSPDGQQLVSTGEDRTVKLWNIDSGQCCMTLVGHSDDILSIAFSPDRKTVATGCLDRTVRLWDINPGECCKVLYGHEAQVWAVAFSQDGQIIASGGLEQVVKMWNVKTGEEIGTLQGHGSVILSLAFSPDGSILASGSSDRTVKLWDWQAGECIQTLQGHEMQVWSVAFNPRDRMLASGCTDRTVKLWDIDTGKTLRTFRGNICQFRSVAFSPDKQMLVSGSGDKLVRLWDANTGECIKIFQGHLDWIGRVVFSPDGKIVASGSADGTVKLWDVNTGECINTLEGYSGWMPAIAFHPQDNILASGNLDQTIKLWNLDTGECFKTLEGHTDCVWCLIFRADGQTLISSSDDQTVKLWDVSSGECLKTLEGHDSWIWAIALHKDNRTLASGSFDRTIRLWNIETGKCLKILEGHSDQVRAVAFSPDGTILASGSADNSIKLWNWRKSECFSVLQGHTGTITTLEFEPIVENNRPILASSSNDETIKFWNIETGKCLKTLKVTKLYEEMNITGTMGLTQATIANLQALGAKAC
jgi:WD40 repeat protein